MKRNVTLFGLAVLVCSALSPPGAFAAEIHGAVTADTVNATQATSHVFTTTAGTVTCKKWSFSGVLPAKTTGGINLLPSDMTNGECTAFGFINVPVHINSCQWTFYANGAAQISCPGTEIEITAPGCTTSIGSQFLASGVTYSNNAGKTDITMTTNLSGIQYTECSGPRESNGTYKGTSTVTGGKGSIWYS